MGSRSEETEPGYWSVPREIRYRPQVCLGDLILLGQPVTVRCKARGQSRSFYEIAAPLPEVPWLKTRPNRRSPILPRATRTSSAPTAELLA